MRSRERRLKRVRRRRELLLLEAQHLQLKEGKLQTSLLLEQQRRVHLTTVQQQRLVIPEPPEPSPAQAQQMMLLPEPEPEPMEEMPPAEDQLRQRLGSLLQQT